MSKQDEISSIERSIKDAKEILNAGKALERLQSNKDYLAVVKKGYFTDEAVRLVHLRGDSQYQTPERQADILKQIDAISSFHQYLIVVRMLADMAAKTVVDGEAALEDLRTEEAE